MVCARMIKGAGSSHLVVTVLHFLAAEPLKTMKNEILISKLLLKMKVQYHHVY